MKFRFKKTEKKQTEKRFVDNAKKKQRKAGKRRKITPFLIVVSVFLIAAAVYLCLTMLFNVDRINIEGNTLYEELDLIETSGIEKGENLFEVNTAYAEDKLYSVYSYIEEVEVKRAFPNAVTIKITEATPFSVIEEADGYTLVSAGGKVLLLPPAGRLFRALRPRGLFLQSAGGQPAVPGLERRAHRPFRSRVPQLSQAGRHLRPHTLRRGDQGLRRGGAAGPQREGQIPHPGGPPVQGGKLPSDGAGEDRLQRRPLSAGPAVPGREPGLRRGRLRRSHLGLEVPDYQGAAAQPPRQKSDHALLRRTRGRAAGDLRRGPLLQGPQGQGRALRQQQAGAGI